MLWTYSIYQCQHTYSSIFFILIFSKIKTPVEVIRTKAWIQTNMRFFEKSQLKGRPPSLLDEDQINYEDSDPEDNSDKLMMTEYDEDNVIVIDLRWFSVTRFDYNGA